MPARAGTGCGRIGHFNSHSEGKSWIDMEAYAATFAVTECAMRTSLNSSQLNAFARDGYLLVPGMLDTEAVAALDRWTDELVAMPETPGRHMVYYEDCVDGGGGRVLSRIENFCPYHEALDGLLRGPVVLGHFESLLGEQPLLFKDKINFKLPGGGGFAAHQDVQAGWDDYAELHLTMLIGIDRATPENGCLEIAPGRHREGMLGERWSPLVEDGATAYRSIPTEPGDVLFFDSFVPHRSHPNRTSIQRRVLYVTYNAASAGDSRGQYYADKRASFPPDCEQDSDRNYSFRV
jgi:hypothetical protein